jgi:hypothetical protein
LEQFMEMKSMLFHLQSEIKSLKNPVDDFTSKWVDTYDVMQMLRLSRRSIDNYIKAGKLCPTRINKRNYFSVTQVNSLLRIPEAEPIRTYHEDIRRMAQKINELNGMGVNE